MTPIPSKQEPSWRSWAPWAGWALLVALFLPFTAEDAWIVLRYAANLAEGQGLVFNPGEQVLALTSPLHALLAAGLHRLLDEPLLVYKGLSILWVGICLRRLLTCLSGEARAGAALLILGSSPLALWTVGGLETPLLIGLACLLAAEVYEDPDGQRPRAALRTGLLAGLLWLGRLDAVLLAGPVVLQRAVKARSWNNRVLLLFLFILPQALWMSMAWQVYGDPLPTSFYVKPPQRDWISLWRNGLETLAWGGLTGMLPTTVFLLGASAAKAETRDALWSRFRRSWGLWLGVVLVWLYGLSVARIHMMFSFRFAVPMLPVLALLLMDGLKQAQLFEGRAWRVWVVTLGLLQAGLGYWTLEHSVNGLSPLGEYGRLSVRAYAGDFLPILEQQALAGQAHWAAQGKDRPPVVMTYAAGVLPYVWRGARILEPLVAWRRRCEFNWQMSADYLQVMTPRMGPLRTQLAIPMEGLRVVASSVAKFDGEEESFLLLYHPDARPNPISARVDLPCSFPDAMTVPWKK